MMDNNIELAANERIGAGATMNVSAKSPSATIEVITTQGPRGNDGRGITSATVDEDGCLIIVFDDGTQYKSESLYVSGGESEPDLVIAMNAPSGTMVDEAALGWFSVKSGNISDVINMLKNHEEPSIALEVDFYYWDYRYSGAAKYSSAVYSYQNDRLVISFDVPYSAHPGNMVYICLWFDPSGQLTDVYHDSKM